MICDIRGILLTMVVAAVFCSSCAKTFQHTDEVLNKGARYEDQICTTDFKPICSTNNETYSNYCRAGGLQNCQCPYTGEWSGEKKSCTCPSGPQKCT